LKRAFFLSASPETVRRTLREESLIVPSKKKTPAQYNPSPVFRTFDAKSDVAGGTSSRFAFGGRYAYLIGFCR